MRNVTLRQLKVFEAVARHLSFSRAADELHLTQPAVSMQVRSLEESVGLALTEQLGKKVFLTEAGIEMARHARVIAQQLREAHAALDAIRGLRGGRLAIGVVSTAKYFAPRLLAEFRSRHPEIELRLNVSNREEVIRQVTENLIDLAIMGQPPDSLETIAAPFAEHPLVIIASPGHRLAGRRNIPARELRDETFLLREPGSGTRVAMERFIAASGINLRSSMEISSNETIKQAVAAGMGISFLSRHTAALELETGRLVELDVSGTPVVRRWHVVRRADKRMLPAAEAFASFLAEKGAALIAAHLRMDVAGASAAAKTSAKRSTRVTAEPEPIPARARTARTRRPR